MKKSYKNLIFVDENRIYKKNDIDRCDLILSPFFYWSKTEELPIKSEKQALKLAPSIFDGILPDGEYKYRVFKTKENLFLFIAYDFNLIKESLENLNIDLEFVDFFYFSQSEFFDMEKAIKLDEIDSIVKIDEIVQKIPTKYIKESDNIQNILEIVKLSKNRISSFELKDSFIDNKTLYSIITILTLTLIAFSIELFIYKQEIKKYLTKQENLYSKYNLPSTSFELKSIKSKFLSIDKKQTSLREKIAYIDKMPLLANEHLIEFNLKSNKLELSIKLSRANRAETIKNYLIKKLKITKMKVNDNILKTEINIWIKTLF